MKPSSKRSFITRALLLLCASASADVLAQSEDAAPVKIQRVEITGSNIKRADAETSLPVQRLSRKEIEQSGAATAAELLANLSGNPGTAVGESQGGDGNFPGFSGVSFRGLGEASTLVLLNGRRIANFAFSGSGADLNAIPLGAIDRVEILADGASAIYGTDAIGGVINFILKQNYQGGDLKAYYAAPQHGGARQRKASAGGGFGDLNTDRYNVLGSIEYTSQTRLAASARSFSRTGYRPDIGLNNTNQIATFPANIAILDSEGNLVGWRNPVLASGGTCGPQAIKVGAACAYDEPSTIDILPASEKLNLLGRTTFKISPQHDFWLEYTYAKNRVQNTSAPGSATIKAFRVDGAPPVIDASNPYFPASEADAGFAVLGMNVAPAGVLLTQTDTNSTHMVAGLRGELAGWDYDTAIAHNQSKAVDAFISGFVSYEKFKGALANGTLNPFGDQGNGSFFADNQVRGAYRHAVGSTDIVDARASRELFALPAGALGVALGAEFRREKFSDIFDQAKTSDAIGYGTAPTRGGTRHVSAVFAELAIPITASLEAQLAARSDRYSDFGSTNNPKASLRWKVSPQVLMRASYGSGFRAPALPELNTPPISTVTFLPHDDPIRCPVTKAKGIDCEATFPVTIGGNPDLQPEKSRQGSIGIVTDPMPGLSASLDYWYVRKNNAIELVFDNPVFANYDQFANLFTRAPSDANFPSLPGRITNVQLGYLNFGSLTTSGFDIDLRYRHGMASYGKLDIGLRGTLVRQFDRTRGAETASLLGRADNGPAIQRWRHTLTVNWDRGPLNMTLSNRFTAGYRDEFLGADGQPRRVRSQSLWDFAGKYAVSPSLALSAGIKNLFDSDPPASNQTDLLQAGYDPRFTDPRGRTVYVSVGYTFSK